MKRCTHFVGFRDDRYWNAVKVFGPPDFIHRKWDKRAAREIAQQDVIVFAVGDEHQAPCRTNSDDLREPRV